MQTKGMPEGNEATNPQTRKGHHSQPKRGKAKGISQMIAGAAVAVIGVPLCVLPGPGVAVIACGAAAATAGGKLAAAGGKAVGDAVARKRRERDAGASVGGKAPKNA